jgi:hypothetical protein
MTTAAPVLRQGDDTGCGINEIRAGLETCKGLPIQGDNVMTVDRMLRGIAGFFVMISVVLGAVHSPHWLWFTGFVGLNLFQSSFTNWCPMMTILRKLGVKDAVCSLQDQTEPS